MAITVTPDKFASDVQKFASVRDLEESLEETP